MTVADYEPFVERMIQRYEGGYGWDKTDPGGPTKYGITCFDLAEFMHQKMDSMHRWAAIVKAMSLATADIIYKQKYATACAFDELAGGCDCAVFDFGVNSGPSHAIKFSQRIVDVNVDGVLGPITLAAINAYSPTAFVNELCNARLGFLRGLGIWHRFGRGWTARVKDLQDYCNRLLRPQLVTYPHAKKLTRIPFAYAKGWESQ